MGKEAILLVGKAGAGKTTLAKFLELNSDFAHFEYDEYIKNRATYFSGRCYDKVIVDALFLNTYDLSLNLEAQKQEGKKVTVIHLNTDDDTCKDNILKRGRTTLQAEYKDIDFQSLKNKFKFDLVIIDNYEIKKADCSENIKTILDIYFPEKVVF